MPSKSSSTRSQPRVPRPPNSRRKPNPASKPNPPLPARATPSYFVLDTTFPTHIVNDRSLFTTYTPSNRVYRTTFGNDITIAGTGNVEICVQAGARKMITFTVRDCWHIPCSSQNFLSCLTVTSPTRRHQVMLAARTPRLLFPHQDRLATPNLPKYVPFTREQGYFVLKFKVPTRIPIPPEPAPADTKSSSQQFHSLYASLCQPFSGLTFTCPTSLDDIGDRVITLENMGTSFRSFGERDASHVPTGNTDTLSPPPSFSPSLPSVYPLPLPKHSSLSFPPTSLSSPSQQLPSGIATALHVHRHPGYTSADFALRGDGDSLVNMNGVMSLNQSSDVGLDAGLHGGIYATSTSADEHCYHHQQPHHLPYSSKGACYSVDSSLPTTVYPMQFQFKPPPALLPQLQHHHHPQNLPSPHVPPPPGLPLPPHHPAPPTVVYPSMMKQPSWIPYPISPYIPQFSPFNLTHANVER